MNKVLALAWEQWRQARLVIGLALGLTLLTDTLVWLSLRHGVFWPNATEFITIIVAALMIGMVLALLMASNNPHDIQLGFQRRLYRLPMATWKLVTIIGLTRLVLVTAACSLMLGMHDIYWSDQTALPFAVLLPVVLMYILLQGVSWSFGTYGWKMGITAALVSLLMAIMFISMTPIPRVVYYRTIWNMSIFEDTFYHLTPISRAVLTIVPGILLLSYAISLIGVRLDRRGTWLGTGAWCDILAKLTGVSLAVNVQQRTFASPEKAQLWFEWRRRGRVFVTIAILTYSITLIRAFNITSIVADWHSEFSEFPQEFRVGILTSQMQSLFFVLPFITLTMGLIMLAMDHRDKLSGVANFLAVRPVHSNVLARARLRVCLRMMYIGTAIAAVGGLLCLALRAAITPNPPTSLHGFYEHFAYYVMPLEGLWGLVAFAILTLIAAWTLLWVATRLALILFVLLALLPATIGSIGDVLINDADLYAFYAMVICIALTVWAFVRAHRSSLVKAYWALPAYVVLAGLCLYCQSTLTPGILNYQDQLWLIGLLALSIAPFATVPLTIHRRRSAHGGIL